MRDAIRPFTRADLLDGYEAARDAVRRRVVGVAKPTRRHLLAGRLLLAFENREIVRYHLLERARAEPDGADAATADAAIADANAALPPAGALACVLVIEIPDPAERAERLAAWGDLARHLYLRLADGRRSFALVRAGDRPEGASVVWRLIFRCDGATPIAVACDHPELADEVALDATQRAALAADLLESST